MADPQRPSPGPVPAGPPGYVIRPPQSSTPAPAQAPAQSGAVGTPAAPASPGQPAPGTSQGTPPVLAQPALVGGLSPNGAILCVAVLLGAAVVFLFLRGAVRSHLISNRAPLSAANGASWALFAFLLVLTATVVFGTVGQLWPLLSFSLPLGALCAITLILFVVLYNSATRVSR